MRIHLLKNDSENNKLGKNTIYVDALDGTLRAGTSLLNPIFEIALDNYLDLQALIDITYPDGDNDIDIMYVDDDLDIDLESYTDTFSIFDVNYVYIEEFKRYYFIKDINVINSKLFILSCECDVLDSHKDELLELDAVIERNEFIYDDSLEDKLEQFEYYQNISYYEPYYVEWERYIEANIEFSGYCYGITYYANSSDYEEVPNYSEAWAPVTDLPGLSKNSMGINSFRYQGFIEDVKDINALADYLDTNSSDTSYIMSLICFPFTLYRLTYWAMLKLGNNMISTDRGVIPICLPDNSTFDQPSPITAYYTLCYYDFRDTVYNWNDYKSYEPYTQYEIYLPFYGYLTLKSTDIKNKKLVVTYGIDVNTGSAKINISELYGRTIKSVTAQIGVKIGVSRTNNQELEDAKNQLAIKTAISGIGSISTIIAGAVMENPLMIGSGIVGIGSTIGNAVTTINQLHESASVQSSSGFEGLLSPRKSIIKITKCVKKDVVDFNKYYGKPLLQTLKLNTLSGYTKVADIHLENISALDGEKSAIESLLKTGIII